MVYVRTLRSKRVILIDSSRTLPSCGDVNLNLDAFVVGPRQGCHGPGLGRKMAQVSGTWYSILMFSGGLYQYLLLSIHVQWP